MLYLIYGSAACRIHKIQFIAPTGEGQGDRPESEESNMWLNHYWDKGSVSNSPQLSIVK